MPPKGRKGKKKKEVEAPLVHREPQELDEVESAMLWDQIGAIHTNALSPPEARNLYTSATVAKFDAGPASPAVVDYVAPNAPLIAIPPQSGGGPRPPHRHITDLQRSNFRLHTSEKEMKSAVFEVTQMLETYRGFWLMMAAEHFEGSSTLKQLTYDLSVLEVTLFYCDQRAEETLSEQQHAFDTERFRLEAQLESLVEQSEVVQSQLSEKREILARRKERDEKFFEIQRRHLNGMKELSKQLTDEREGLQEKMHSRLLSTTEEMAKLTAAQREERQRRAQEESNRLVAELTVLEKRSKHLNDRSMKLQQQSDSARRDRELEQHRRALLLQKNHRLGEDVKHVVSDLQELEREVAEKQIAATAGRKVTNEAVLERVDDQYETIATLRRELESVVHDTESVREQIHTVQRQLLAEAGGKHLPVNVPRLLPAPPIPPSSSTFSGRQRDQLQLQLFGSETGTRSKARGGGPETASPPERVTRVVQSLDNNTLEAIRAVVLEAVQETNQAMSSLPVKGCTTVYDLPDPYERLLVQNYVARRVSRLLSGIYPSAPPFSFLRAAAANPSKLSTSL